MANIMNASSTFPDFRTSIAQMSDDELAELLRARPDTSFPLPPGVNSLTARLVLPGSISRAVRTLTALEIAVLEVAGDLGAELEPVDIEAIVDRVPVNSALAEEAVARLRAAGLMFGTAGHVRVTPGALGALPAGWRMQDTAPDKVDELVAGLDRQQRAVLETLAASGSVGTTRDAAIDADPSRPVPRLLASGLLVRVNSTTVRLPRPVRDALRGQTSPAYPLAPSPRMSLEPTPNPRVDAAATAAGLEATRTMRRLIATLGRSPVALNKDGSVGVRALAGLSKELGVEACYVALLVAVGESAGIIGRGLIDDHTDGLAPTKDAPAWADARLADQWAIMLAGWLASPWQVEQLDQADEKGNPIRLLSGAMHTPAARGIRSLILTQFTRVAGHGLSRDEAVEDLSFTSPVVASGISGAVFDSVLSQAFVVGALAEAATSDATGWSASSALAALLDDGGDVAAATANLVPAEVSIVIPQADMTILAPGPLAPELQRVIESFTELESYGLASVFRVTEASVRAAFDAGRTPDELVGWLHEHSPGGVPQPMEFLIRDAARGYGQLQAGEAMSYVRSDDPALISQAAASLSDVLTLIAPQAAVSSLPLTALVSRLRNVGLHPTAEGADGATLAMAPEPVLVSATPSTLPKNTRVDEAHIAAAVAAIRAADAEGADDPATAQTTESAEADHVAVLQAAARGGRPVAIGYVNKNGKGQQITVTPLSVSAGQVDAINEKTGAVVRIALPRVTRVVLE
ncbi:helicase-associated domain-containing protein [Corynebacterium cystitidis]|uniref:Helicase conserved C-terminal domain-containing protein n=1 Tax=Corynebacterium cystitidis DSM 20524 TaxID=1121357 RepID=A0A1H9WH27_9CORY|nr:helicase-associated domain-containing protein [Corynebacterium cystitidis]WJY81864.1 hypothetical protein CCYS_04590 [Corynebacterium cystitidis DSM 20524]SES33059.1 Helicase conserved C-terminal domain-containing protein [Corynebacterium cystitidis DSM 20524]SNV82660.1 putative DNA-binding protein [Corynebacterium cystitidis]